MKQENETRKERKRSISEQRDDKNEMEEGFDMHTLDVVRHSHLIWNQVSENTFAWCGIKSKILLEVSNTELQNESEKATPVSKSKSVEVIVSAFKNIFLSAQNVSLDDSNLEIIPAREDLSAWLDIEDVPEVREAFVADAMQGIEGLKMERCVLPESKMV